MILATLPMSGAFAAAMDRSGQSISAFLQPGNYFEAGISVLDADVSGNSSTIRTLQGQTIPSEATGDMASSYYFPSAALKIQATDNISVGLLYDQPFGAKAEYKDKSAAFNPTGEDGTKAEVHTQNLTLLVGYQPNENWNVYAGPVFQEAKGNVALRGAAYSALSGYNADLKRSEDWGWAAGFAYQIPEIALKASLTYRSKIKHKLGATENASTIVPGYGNATLQLPLEAFTYSPGPTDVHTPESVNLDLQSGIMADTVAFLNVRWVHWDGFAIRPTQFGQTLDQLAQQADRINLSTYSAQDPRLPLAAGTKAAFESLNGGNLVEYNKNQWSATTGVGRKFNEKWAGNVSVGWDSGAGNPVTTLGPTDGYWNLGLGLQFSPAPDYFIAGGVKYFWLGDTEALTVANPNVGEFKDNHAIAYGLKFGYRF